MKCTIRAALVDNEQQQLTYKNMGDLTIERPLKVTLGMDLLLTMVVPVKDMPPITFKLLYIAKREIDADLSTL